ncbi:MAG: 2-hydroxyacyl-CoA dehydratase [Desulfatibacillum sp.]|nr:2-hydroxyacyl-CoA dehydratase [Desulfatibacillum sp.]
MNAIQNQLEALHSQGNKVLGCFPLYPPLELIHSMGIVPVILWGFKPFFSQVPLADRHVQNYACSVGRYLMEFVLQDKGKSLDGLLMYNACDTLRNLPEIIQKGLGEETVLPLHSFHIPALSMDRSGAKEYLHDRLDELIAWLETTFSAKFSLESFQHSVNLYGQLRQLMLKCQALAGEGKALFSEYAALCETLNFMPLEAQIPALEKFCAQKEANKPAPCNARVLMSGILPPLREVLEILESAGLRIVANDIASMHRAWAYTPAFADDPAAYYADLYENHFPCTTLLPTADRRLAALESLLENSQARAWIFAGEKFCEHEYFELPYVEKALKARGISTLNLEFSLGDEQNLGAMKTRIEAFAEIMND